MPRGRPPRVDYLRDDFLESIGSAERLFDAVLPLSAVRIGGGHRALHVKQVRRVVELAFMGVCAAWEEFLEQTMMRYMAGAALASGHGPTLRLGRCEGIDHAYQVFAADPQHDPARKYLSWTNPALVVQMAQMYFRDGEPYATAINNFAEELRRAVKLRNRVAHSSQKCIEEFRGVANYYLDPQAVTQGYGVGDLLRSNRRRNFNHLPPVQPGHPARNYFQAHMEMFRTLANAIVPP